MISFKTREEKEEFLRLLEEVVQLVKQGTAQMVVRQLSEVAIAGELFTNSEN